MIVNSQPYNPSQGSQQQRCIGLEPLVGSSSLAAASGAMGRLSASNNQNNNNSVGLSTPSSSQQNSLYGSSFSSSQQQQTSSGSSQHQNLVATSNSTTISHMFDLANLHQQQQTALVFDQPTYDKVAMSNNNSNNQNKAVDLSLRDINNGKQPANRLSVNNNSSNLQTTNNDHQSLYSPSSSTSLLYHIYDQINLPSEHYQMATNQQQSNNNNKTTTILNPANLFGGPQQQQNQQPPMQLQLHHHQQQQPNCYPINGQYHTLGQQQQPFATLIHQQQQQQQYQAALDTVMRQHQAAIARQSMTQRPLSSSGGSSMTSGQSASTMQHSSAAANQQTIAYGRQPRLPASTLKANAGASLMASVLMSQQLSHSRSSNTLGAGHLGHLNGSSLVGAAGAGSGQDKSAKMGGGGLLSSAAWAKQVNRRARHLIYEYRTIVKCSLLLIILALGLMSLIKFSQLPSASSSSSNLYSSSNQLDVHRKQQQQQQVFSGEISASASISSPSQLYPQLITSATTSSKQQQQLIDQNNGLQATGNTNPMDGDEQSGQNKLASAQQPDVLKSKLVIGEFIISSQNYSESQAQRSLLAERIVKLMDQVFLSTDVQRVYSRMEVTNIRPNRGRGIIVNCNIILSESIAYAAQQFGIALYDSLAKSHERLNNQPNYTVDKNSILFNTVPDKDLKSGIVPPGLISPAVSRELALGSSQQEPAVAPSAGGSRRPTELAPIEMTISSPTEESNNLVVWSEWSQWSSCLNKNGNCDETRIHSRIRKCVAQNTGEQVDALRCRDRFSMQDLEFEVKDCTLTCRQQQQQSQQIMSDAPSMIGPQTAPSVLVDSNLLPSAAFMTQPSAVAAKMQSQSQSGTGSGQQNKPANEPNDLFTPPSATAASSSGSVSSPNPFAVVQSSLGGGSSTERSSQPSVISGSSGGVDLSSTPTLIDQQQQPNIQLQQSQMSCSNCTSDEICLLLMQQKVPFCAKIKDQSDESGCGGWCKAQNQLCQPVGQNAFKCIHDSECLDSEWRCHDSACIPLTGRCDGHSNCYDSSDERDCPIS